MSSDEGLLSVSDTSMEEHEGLTYREIEELENTLLEGDTQRINKPKGQNTPNNEETQQMEDEPKLDPNMTTPEGPSKANKTKQRTAQEKDENDEKKQNEVDSVKEPEKMNLRHKKPRNYMDQHTGKITPQKCDECDNMKKKVKALEEKMKTASSMTPKTKKLQEEIKTLKDQAKQMMNERIDQELQQEEITELKEKVETLHQNTRDLEEKVDTLQHENECLIVCNDTLQEELEECTPKTEYNQLEQENKTLKQTINNMQIREAKNKAEHDKTKQESNQRQNIIDKLNKEVADLTGKIKPKTEESVLILGDSNAKRYTPKIQKDNKKVEIALA